MRGSAVIAIVFACCVFAQTKGPTFEAASVKASPPRDGTARYVAMSGGPGTGDPTHIVYHNVALFTILRNVYDAWPFQISGPDWLGLEAFDITATLPDGTTKEQFHEMLLNLLAERFHLKLHRESREVSGYELLVARSGSKLKEAAGSDTPDLGFLMDFNGAAAPSAHLKFRAQQISGLVHSLGEELGRPVVDKTGLAGRYNFTFDYTVGAANVGADAGASSTPNVLTAAREQLGLNLVSSKVPLEMIIVDSADKVPTGN
jgi:uncharacterized protein (TIGR03435 family)